MIRRMTRRPVASAVGIIAALIGVAVAGSVVPMWWAGLSLVQRILVVGAGTLIGIGLIDRIVNSIAEHSPLAGVVWAVRGIIRLGHAPEPNTGRDQFLVGQADWLWRALARDQDGSVPVDSVKKRDADHLVPVVNTDTSVGLSGETGGGKSESAKAQIQEQGYDEPVMAHGLVQPPDEPNSDPAIPAGTTEWFDFFQREGLSVEKVGPENSTVRWNSYLDLREDLRDITNLAESLYYDPKASETGWDEAGRSMLQSALVLTDAEYGDIAYLSDVMDGYGPDGIIERVENIPEIGPRAVSSLRLYDDDELRTIFGRGHCLVKV